MCIRERLGKEWLWTLNLIVREVGDVPISICEDLVSLGRVGALSLIMWVVWFDYVGCCSWFVWVLLVSLGLLWVHLGALSYTLCIIGWRLL
jgi:hypothetical protein